MEKNTKKGTASGLNAETPTAKEKKSKKEPAKSLDQVNADNLETVSNKINKGEASLAKLKYRYPDDINDQLSRKDWRRKVRAKIASFEKKIANLTKVNASTMTPDEQKELARAQKKFQAYKDEIYM